MVKFNIIMPVYNSEKWITQSIESVCRQSYGNWKLIVADDCSSDKTIEQIMKFHNSGFSIEALKNKARKGPLLNQYFVLKNYTEPDSVIIHLDGDDWLADKDVLKELSKVYKSSETWATYGNYKSLSGGISVCRPIDPELSIRKNSTVTGWCFSHLRTYRQQLVKYLRVADMVGKDGKFFMAAADVAIFLPILEMCGKDRIVYHDRINLIYNDLNPISESTAKNVDTQIKTAVAIYNKQPYAELPKRCKL